MKAQITNENQVQVITLRTEDFDDHFLLGIIAQKAGKNAQVYPIDSGTRELQMNLKILLILLA